MKVLAQPIEVISYTNDKGDVRPLRFRIQIGEEPMQVMKIDKIIFKQKEKLAGNAMILYRCQGMNGDTEKVFELKYELDTCKWMLYKI